MKRHYHRTKGYLRFGDEFIVEDSKQNYVGTLEFFYNSLFPAKSWQDTASIHREKQK